MGILDSGPDELTNRRRVLRRNIDELARRDGLTHREAVEAFATQIGRSAKTVYGWLAEHSKRPFPGRHYYKMVERGALDPGVQDRDDTQERRYMLHAKIDAIVREKGVTRAKVIEMLAEHFGRRPTTVADWLRPERQRPIPPHLYYQIINQGILDPPSGG